MYSLDYQWKRAIRSGDIVYILSRIHAGKQVVNNDIVYMLTDGHKHVIRYFQDYYSVLMDKEHLASYHFEYTRGGTRVQHTHSHSLSAKEYGFILACERPDRLEVVQTMFEHIQPYYVIQIALWVACANGATAIAEYLWSKGVTNGLRVVCELGDVDLVRVWRNILTGRDFRPEWNSGWQAVCQSGYLPVAKELLKDYEDPMESHQWQKLFGLACKHCGAKTNIVSYMLEYGHQLTRLWNRDYYIGGQKYSIVLQETETHLRQAIDATQLSLVQCLALWYTRLRDPPSKSVNRPAFFCSSPLIMNALEPYSRHLSILIGSNATIQDMALHSTSPDIFCSKPTRIVARNLSLIRPPYLFGTLCPQEGYQVLPRDLLDIVLDYWQTPVPKEITRRVVRCKTIEELDELVYDIECDMEHTENKADFSDLDVPDRIRVIDLDVPYGVDDDDGDEDVPMGLPIENTINEYASLLPPLPHDDEDL